MKTLTLVRHAKSSWSDSSVSDHDRKLNPRGLKDAPEMGRRLAAVPCIPDKVFCSTAVRARQTAELLLPAIGLDPASSITLKKEIYEASVRDLLDTIAEADDSIQHLMLIGHNPGFEMLCHTLKTGAVSKVPSCAVASFSIPAERWSELENIVGDKQANIGLEHHDFPKKR